MRLTRVLLPAAAATAVALALAGCAGTSGSAGGSGSTGGSGSASGTVAITASTDVWGDIAKTVGGDHVSVTSIIDDPDKDPHEYEVSARAQLAVKKATLLIENGGGYDDFMGRMIQASGNSSAPVIDAVRISGFTAADEGGELNEHVWYDLPTADKVAERIAADLGRLQPANEADFQENAKAFGEKLDGLEQREAEVKKGHAGAGVAITEPVPLYMLDAMGLTNRTPEKFSEAVEEDTDVAPSVLNDTLSLFSGKQVALLAYNEQTTGAQTEAVLKAAKENAIPVVGVTETLPEGDDFVSWMGDNIDHIHEALSGR